MDIQTVKHSGDGYLVNELIIVPNDEANTSYQAVQKWIENGGVVGAEFTQSQLFEKAVSDKLDEIEKDFRTAESEPVVVNGISFIGGQESATSIDQYVRLMRLANQTIFNIWDVNGDEHPLDGAGADEVILAIGSASSANKFEKKDRKKALANATTITEVNAV